MKALLWLLAVGLSLAFPLPMLILWAVVWLLRNSVQACRTHGPAPTGAAMRGVAPAIAPPPVFSPLEHRFRLISGGRG